MLTDWILTTHMLSHLEFKYLNISFSFVQYCFNILSKAFYYYFHLILKTNVIKGKVNIFIMQPICNTPLTYLSLLSLTTSINTESEYWRALMVLHHANDVVYINAFPSIFWASTYNRRINRFEISLFFFHVYN